jgi:cation:H+ antiporter
VFHDFLLLAAGLFVLYLGAELLVRSSSRLALLLSIPPVIVGLTVVAFGTSSPEFLVSFMAAYAGKIDLSVGNIVGSNIANIGLVLGFSVLLRPIRLMGRDIKRELYWLTGTSLLFYLFSLNYTIMFLEGLIFLLILVFLTLFLIFQALSERRKSINNAIRTAHEVPEIPIGIPLIDRQAKNVKVLIFLVLSIGGIIALIYGSKITITAAERLAVTFGVSQTVIGLTVVAFGTSLPEFATGIVSVIKKENEILLGNVIGSNLFNILGVAGPVALFYVIPLERSLIYFEFPLMILYTLIMLFFLLYKGRLIRPVGLIFFLVYIIYFFRLIA